MKGPGLYVQSLTKWSGDPGVRIEKVDASGRSTSVTIEHHEMMDLLENLAARLENNLAIRRAVSR